MAGNPNRPLLTAGPFIGVNDTIPLAGQDMTRLASLVNGYARRPELRDDIYARPGFTRGTVGSVASLPTRFGSAVSAPLYALTSMQDESGVFYNLFLVKIPFNGAGANGEDLQSGGVHSVLVKYNATTGVYTYAMDGNIAVTSATFDAAATRLWFCSFAGYLIMSDGTNRLLKWDPNFSAGSGSVTQLTDTSEAVYGPPTVYSGKLFYIPKTSRNTIKWSDENDPDSGYDGAQAWDFVQTGSDPLARLVGTNDALYVFRENSITAVYGTANSDFRSASTKPAVDMNIGTKSPGAVVLGENGDIWFLDQLARPQKLVPGRGRVDMWLPCYETIKTADTSDAALFQAWGCFVPNLSVVVFGYRATSGAAGSVQLLVFHSRTSEFLGTWTITSNSDMRYGVIFRDANNKQTLAVTEFGASSLSWELQQQDTDTNAWADVLASTIVVPLTFETPKMYGDVDMQKEFNRVVLTSQLANSTPPRFDIQVRGSNSSTYPTAAQMQVNTPSLGANIGNPTRHVAQVDLANTRWLQAKCSNTNSGVTSRASFGEVRLYGTEDLMDWEAA